ncbi:MAG: hypothetical protein R2795_24805 [Saprospiraceae bacterium]
MTYNLVSGIYTYYGGVKGIARSGLSGLPFIALYGFFDIHIGYDTKEFGEIN